MTDAPKGALSHRGHEPGLSDASEETPKQSRPFLEDLFSLKTSVCQNFCKT